MVLGNEFYFVCVYFYGKGVGDIYIQANCRTFLTKTYEVQDCIKYAPTEISKTSSSTTLVKNPIYTGLSFNTNHFQLEFDIKGSRGGFGVGIGSADNSSFQYAVYIGYDITHWRTWKPTSPTTNQGTTSNIPQNIGTYSTIKMVYDNGTVDIYANNSLVIQYTGLSSLFDDINKTFVLGTWDTTTVNIKNIKIKPL